jgi:hypothetical protein
MSGRLMSLPIWHYAYNLHNLLSVIYYIRIVEIE